MENGEWKMDTGPEASAGSRCTSPAKASSPSYFFHFPFSIFH
jgi:hypothetical protein